MKKQSRVRGRNEDWKEDRSCISSLSSFLPVLRPHVHDAESVRCGGPHGAGSGAGVPAADAGDDGAWSLPAPPPRLLLREV